MNTLNFVDSISQNISEGYYLGIVNALKIDFETSGNDKFILDEIIKRTQEMRTLTLQRNQQDLELKAQTFLDTLDFLFIEPSDRKEFFVEYLKEKLLLSQTVVNKLVKKFFK